MQDLDLRPRGTQRGLAQVVGIVQGLAIDRLERSEDAASSVDVPDRENGGSQHPGGPGALGDEGLVFGVLPNGSRGRGIGRVLEANRLPQPEELRGSQLVNGLDLDEDTSTGGGRRDPRHGASCVSAVELVELDDDEPGTVERLRERATTDAARRHAEHECHDGSDRVPDQHDDEP